MSNWKAEADKILEQRVYDGENPSDVVRELVLDYSTEILLDAERRLADTLQNHQRKVWAEPPADMAPLRFDLNGLEFAISDAPVCYVDGDGERAFMPARLSTGDERETSLAMRIQHHQDWTRRSEAEHRRETEQNATAATLDVPLSITPWEQIRHANTKCWRCLGGWEPGNPFELGHSDKPESQGGVTVEWEHRNCNRSAQDNPTAR